MPVRQDNVVRSLEQAYRPRRPCYLSDDPLRADLVGFTWTNDHCTVSVIEVKAVQAKGSEYAVESGVVTGAAIDQMLSTRRLLEQVFADNRDDELITTPARREILREHLYRELTKGTYTADERKLWADRLQRLLDGAVTTDLRCHLIDVRLGVDSDSLNAMNVAALDGGNPVPVEITELNERQIEVLIPTEPPEPGPEADEGGEPEPPARRDAARGGPARRTAAGSRESRRDTAARDRRQTSGARAGRRTGARRGRTRSAAGVARDRRRASTASRATSGSTRRRPRTGCQTRT